MSIEQIDNIQEKLNWHWRNSMRTVRFMAAEARAALPLPFLLVYARWSTLFLTIAFLAFFRFLERKGLTFPAALRTMRLMIIGKDRPGVVSAHARKFTDHG